MAFPGLSPCQNGRKDPVRQYFTILIHNTFILWIRRKHMTQHHYNTNASLKTKHPEWWFDSLLPSFCLLFLNATLLITIFTLLCIKSRKQPNFQMILCFTCFQISPFPRVSIFCNHLGAGLCAVHDGVAAVKRKGILKFSQTLLGKFITGVNHPPICLQNNDIAVNSCFYHSFRFIFILNYSTNLLQAELYHMLW